MTLMETVGMEVKLQLLPAGESFTSWYIDSGSEGTLYFSLNYEA